MSLEVTWIVDHAFLMPPEGLPLSSYPSEHLLYESSIERWLKTQALGPVAWL